MKSDQDQLEAIKLNSGFSKISANKKWTGYLLLCCMTVSLFSFQFGYNIASLNSPTELIKDFIRLETFLFADYYNKTNLFKLNEGYIKGNESLLKNAILDYETKKSEYIFCSMTFDYECVEKLEKNRQEKAKYYREKFNMTIDEYIADRNKTLYEKKEKLEFYRGKLGEAGQKVQKATDIVWTILNCLFVVGGMIGAFTSKYVLDLLGRKKGLLFNGLFSIAGGILVVIAPYVKSPICVIVSRFLFGVQGGMACSLVPTYLSEISPSALRGRTGVMAQLFITLGILAGQILGFRELLGTKELWHILLFMPLVIATIAMLLLILFFSETPKALLIKNKDYDSAKEVLQKLRNREDVNEDIQAIYDEEKQGSANTSTKSNGFFSLFKDSEARWPLLTSIVVHAVQQLCGINAVFFYSSSIFKDAGIPSNYIQYAILSTGLVNFFATILCVPLIDKLGRKPLLVYPMIIMIVDFIALTVFLIFKEKVQVLAYLSIVCIIIFVICFAVGLGPIPFIYTAEVFRQNTRSSAMAISLLVNWSSGLILTISFPFLQAAMQQYVFLVFLAIVALALIVLVFKLKETKGKNIEEILNEFNK